MSDLFKDQVALVTGTASGIGRACVEEFLARGATAVGLDINPRIVDLFDRPDYMGVVCDIGDEQNICQAVQAVAQQFEHLDMLVLNAGIFPASCLIEKISLVEWNKVMRINLDANVIFLRECYPLLRVAPKGGGRVVVNASRNVPAPGQGAAAYSVSNLHQPTVLDVLVSDLDGMNEVMPQHRLRQRDSDCDIIDLIQQAAT